MEERTSYLSLTQILGTERPQAVAWIQGNEKESQLGGVIKFYSTPFDGILVEAELYGLPDKRNESNFYAFHIHEIGDCSNQFSHTGMHYNPTNQMHPYHAGDMISLLSNNGYVWNAFFDGRLRISELIGRSVIIHAKRDDFTSQPAGDAGEKIGCGVIRFVR